MDQKKNKTTKQTPPDKNGKPGTPEKTNAPGCSSPDRSRPAHSSAEQSVHPTRDPRDRLYDF